MHEALQHWVQAALELDTPPALTPLAGSTSTTLYAIQTGRAYVLRVYDNPGWLAEEPDLPLHEAAAQRLAYDAGLPAPEPVALAVKGEAGPVPALLMTRVTGRIVLQPADRAAWLHELAATASRIHAVPVDPDDFPWSFVPYTDPAAAAVPAWTDRPDLWARAIAIAQQPPPAEPPGFIHRDYHMVNVLWTDDRISGIVDWPNACVGPLGEDIARCRGNLAALHGLDAADDFQRAYEAIRGRRLVNQPYWDIRGMLDMLLADPAPPDVYSGWTDYGVTGLTAALVQQRSEDMLARAVAAWG